MTARYIRLLLVTSLGACLAACSGKDAELDQFIAQTKQEPGGGVQPLPDVRPYESFVYAAQTLRSPFVAGMPASATATTGVRPDQNRPREFLEQFSLDTLKMVGTLRFGGAMYGLVQTKDKLVHRVIVGNYIGQADGRISEITPSKIVLTEIVPDGLGGYIERPAALGLVD